jgi:hypothetical protein
MGFSFSLSWFNPGQFALIGTAVGTWALVVGTLVFMYWQMRQTQRLNSANAVMALRERFDSTRMRAVRRHLADRLLRGAHDDISSMEVVTFFELVGTLTHRGVLEDELVWEAFGTWIESYWWALRHPMDLVGELRRTLQDPLIFHEFEWLNDRLRHIDRRMLGPEHADTVHQDTESPRILQRETQLESLG